MESKGGVLYLIGTPIGNMEDLSLRAIRILGEVDALACEDTRVTRRLLDRYEIKPPKNVFSCHDHNEATAAKRILGLLKQDMSVGLCTDGGMPGISDPGYRVTSLAREEGFPVEVIPGPTAAASAMSLSGLPTSSYVFLGFPPRKSGARQRFLASELESKHTLVLYESPFRIGALLADAHAVLGDRLAAVCVELTKRYERVHRGHLGDLAEAFSDKKVKGEVTLVIAGNNPKFTRATVE